DLRLRDLVDLLADRLADAWLHAEPDTHEHDPEEDRQHRPDHQVRDCFVDRHVQRPEMDRNPRMQLELVLGVEIGCKRLRRQREREADEHEEGPLHHRCGCPLKYATTERPSSNVYASAYRSAAPSASFASET